MKINNGLNLTSERCTPFQNKDYHTSTVSEEQLLYELMYGYLYILTTSFDEVFGDKSVGALIKDKEREAACFH